MIPIREYFVQFCYDTFGEEDGKIVKSFYDLFFAPKHKYSKWNPSGFLKTLSRQDKVDSINYVLSHTTKGLFIAYVKDLLDKMEQSEGTIKSHNLVYFHKAAIGYKPKNIIATVEIKIIIPKKNQKVFDSYDPEFLNWNYKCECSYIFDGWTTDCPKCKAHFDWRGI